MLGKRSLQLLLVFCLVFGLVVGSVGSIGAQTPEPNSRAAVEVEIKKYAARRVENDLPMDTSTAMKVFEKNVANLTQQDVATIYEEEFVKLKKVKDEDFWEQVKPKAGWIVAAMITVFALFQGKLKAWVENIVGAIEKGIYQRLSGTKFFRNVALRKYRSALVEKHQSLKIPFRPNRPLDLAGIYVPLKVAGNRTEPSVEALQVIRDCRKLMVKGQPGSGKTILLKYLALNYGLGELRLKDDPIVILLELHRLSGGVEVLPALVDALERDDFPNGTKFLEQALDAGRVVLLLDGLDEVNTSDRPSVVKRIKDFFDRYGKCGVVITCRSQVYQNEFVHLVDQTWEVVEFTDAQIQQFLRSWKAEMPPEKSVQQLLQSLRNRPRIKELARNPLLLTIIAYLYCDARFELPHSRSEFYKESTRILLSAWDRERETETPNRYKELTKRSVLQHLALFAQDGTGDRKTLSRQDVMAQVKAVLLGLNFDADRDVEPILNELVERSGLLLEIDRGARYQFSHLTLQEFFAAGALADRSTDLIQRVESDPDAWREVVKLWCGLANDSTAVIRQIYISQPVMAFECLADAQNVDAALADEIIDRFQQQIGQTGQDPSVGLAFAAVAADLRPRGRQVFQFLADALEQPGDEASQMTIMTGLSLTNLPQAAKALCQNYCEISTLHRSAITRMGDVAVPELSKLIEVGGSISINALNDLISIRTPDAVQMMVPLLWHKHPDIAGRTAWYLADFLRDLDMEAAFHEIKLTSEQKGSPEWSWVWEPFSVPKDSSLPEIASKIADILSSYPLTHRLLAVPTLRFVVPICAFSKELTENLPKTLSDEAEDLCRSIGKNDDPDRSEQSKKLLEELVKGIPSEAISRKLLSSYNPQFQLRFLNCLVTDRKAKQRDWLNLHRRVKYDFQNGWHYRLVLSVAVMTSIAALIEMFYLPFQAQEQWTSWLVAAPAFIVVMSWLFLWQGIEARLESDLFWKFAVFGSIRFWLEVVNLLKYKTVWDIVEPLANFIRNGIKPFLSAVSVLVLVPDNPVIAAEPNPAITEAVNAEMRRAPKAQSFLSHAFLMGMTISVALVSVSSMGLLCWKSSRSTPDYKRYFAIFSYPLFCAFPIVLIYSSLALHNFFPWQTVVLIWLTIITVCTLLWQRGQKLDRAARNPFQKILAGYYEMRSP